MMRHTHHTSSSTYHSQRNLLAWSLLSGLIIFCALAGPFFAGRIYTRNDLGAFHLPIRDFYARQLAQGEAFDWMPQLFAGFYLTGEGQGGTYHPLHLLLYRFLSLRAAMGLEWLISYPFMLAGTWLFLHRWLKSPAAAMFGGVIFTFSSFNLLHFIHPNAVAIVAHLPWLLWAIDVVLVDAPKKKVYSAAMLIALLTGSQLLLGYPQYVWMSLLMELAYTLYLLFTRRHIGREGCRHDFPCRKCIDCDTATWPDLLLAKCIGLFLGGAQLAPTLDALMHSARQSADNAFASMGSLHPLNLVQLVAPYMFVNRVVGQNTHELGLYLGAVPLLLIVLLVMQRHYLGAMKSLALFAALFAAVALILAFGQHGLLYHWLTYLPLVGTFRFPARYIVLFQLASAILSVLGFMLLLRISRQERRRRLAAAAFVPANKHQPLSWRQLALLWLPAAVSTAAATAFIANPQPFVASLPLVLSGPILFIVATFLVFSAARGSFMALVALILFSAFDLGVYGLSYSVYPSCPRWQDFIANIEIPPENTEGRVVASLYRYDLPGLRVGDQMILRGWRRADGYAGLEPNRLLDYRQAAALRVAGVRWVQRDSTTAEIQGLIPRDDNWSEAPNPLPRVRLINQTIVSDQPAVDIAEINIDTEALTEVSLVFPAGEPGKALLVEDVPGRMVIETDASAPQLLVVAESYHPGWKATMDGNPLQTYRVNGDYLGCVVSAGTQLVTLWFQPASLRTGWLLSALGLGFLPLCFLGLWIKPRNISLQELHR